MSQQNIENARTGLRALTSPASVLAGLPARVDRCLLRLNAAGVLDARHVSAAPGSLLIECVRFDREKPPGWRLRTLAAGSPRGVTAHPEAPGATVIDLPGMVLLPALVNAHAHLDLSHIGPRSFESAEGFDSWLGMIRRERRVIEGEIRTSVQEGVRLSRAGGVLAIGDIAGGAGELSLASASALASSGMAGVSFLEFFAIGRREPAGLDQLKTSWQKAQSMPPQSGWNIGLHPHAPYSVGRNGYAEALALADGGFTGRAAGDCGSVRICTHVAESLAERDLVMNGRGPLRAFLERIGVWDEQRGSDFGKGLTPIAYLGEELLRRIDVLVHANDLADSDIEMLSRASRVRRERMGEALNVVFCPRAARYFGHDRDLGPHRWRELLEAGVNVAVGTDSIVNLETPDRISPLDDLRELRQSAGGMSTSDLLAMASWRGALALGMNPEPWSFGEGHELAGVVGVPVTSSGDPLEQVVAGRGVGELLFGGIFSG